MSRSLSFVLIVPAVIALVGCGGGGGAPSTAMTEFGVPECDAYMTKYMACVAKMPEPAQAAARQSLDQTKAAWQRAAATAQGKSALAMTCKTASDAAAASMSAYGCW